MNLSRIESVLLGRNRKVMKYFLLLTTAAVFVVLGLVIARDMFGITLTVLVSRGISVYLIPALFLLAALNAYYNDGVLISWLIIFAPLFSAFINYIGGGVAIGTNPTQFEWILSSASYGLLYAVVLGTLAFVLGASGRRVIGYISQRG